MPSANSNHFLALQTHKLFFIFLLKSRIENTKRSKMQLHSQIVILCQKFRKKSFPDVIDNLQ